VHRRAAQAGRRLDHRARAAGHGDRAAPPRRRATAGEPAAGEEAGATGYLLKDTPREELFRAVVSAHRGESVLSPSVAGRLMGQLRAPAKEPLSQRELEVLRLISQGSSNRETAGKLFISEATVKTHLLHVYAKLGVRDRAAAVAAAFERGFLSVPE
jgi:DNA-binding NarL/FixJ family response regulator